jgi:tetratricopeptide (TPR) repeat protein
LEGQPTARSDIYSLGLTLYELLAGCPAYEDSSSSQLLQRIRQGDITPLRAVDTNFPRDLEAILRKATDKEELQRYHTARDLADDLERLLTNRPVRARQITPLGYAVRWTQRNPLAAGLSCIAAILLIGVITVTTLGYFSAKAGERRETALRQSEKEQRLREAAQRRRAEAALGVAMESLEELFAQIESNRRPGQRLAPEEARGMLDALGRMLAFYEQLATQGQGGRQSQIRVAEALRRMGDLHRSLHEYDDAEAALLRAIASLEGLIEDVPDETEPHIQHARASYTLGRVYRDMGRRDEGDPLIQLAVTELEALPSDAPQGRHIQELLIRFRRDVRRVPGE